jgi:hypothetical protein
VPIDVAVFADAGVAWRGPRSRRSGGPVASSGSAGAAMRINVLGLPAVELSAYTRSIGSIAGFSGNSGIRQGF